MSCYVLLGPSVRDTDRSNHGLNASERKAHAWNFIIIVTVCSFGGGMLMTLSVAKLHV
jgi:hypothetical protein